MTQRVYSLNQVTWREKLPASYLHHRSLPQALPLSITVHRLVPIANVVHQGRNENLVEPTAPSSSKASLIVVGKSDTEVEEVLDQMLTHLTLCGDSKLDPLFSKFLSLHLFTLPVVCNKVLVREKRTNNIIF
ncbi:hypothetical protein Ahy_B03g064762 isoform B [Arachis hypogaea]|uniref:Uncharacterized protein n=1 Tax=Arachis hypogaea TaxID=3818 RepID=A0A445A0E5_ARAHY|nr:hypothetical protein Ahy_B03g064762 isoform B [Arachis hypogaea]